MTAADWVQILSLMRRVADGGGDAAWSELLTALEPELVRLARYQPIGRLREQEDSPREIVARVIARLHARDHASLVAMFAEEPLPHPRAWIRLLVRRSAIDYMREHPDYIRNAGGDGPRWVTLVSLITGEGIADPDTLSEKRREVIAFVTAAVDEVVAAHQEQGDQAIEEIARRWRVPRLHVRRLVTRGSQLVQVLQAVLEGLAHTEVAERLTLSRREVQLSVKYIEELLRARRFGAAD